MFRQDLFSWHDGAWRSPRIGRWRSSNRSPTPRSDPVPWPARLRNATRSLTLSRRRDRCARVGVASAPKTRGRLQSSPLWWQRERVPERAQPYRSGSMAITFQTEGLGVNSFSRSARLWNMRSPACISLAAPHRQRFRTCRKRHKGQLRTQPHIGYAWEIFLAPSHLQMMQPRPSDASSKLGLGYDDGFDLRLARARLVVIGLQDRAPATARH